MIKQFFLVLMFGACCTNYSYSQKSKITSSERESMQVFTAFSNYINNSIKNKIDVTDSAQLQFVLKHFIFINVKTDISQPGVYKYSSFRSDQLSILKQTIGSFYQFLLGKNNEKLRENLVALPARLSPDKCIYNELTSFQKKNTLIFFDKRYPKKILGYLLIFPPMKNISNKPKIWSWNLEFTFGKYLFISFTGEKGYEYMFTGK